MAETPNAGTSGHQPSRSAETTGTEARISRLMRPSPKPLLLLESHSLGDLLVRFRRHPVLPVVDAQGRVQGAVSRGSLLALRAHPLDGVIPVERVMRSTSELAEDSTVEQAARAFTRDCVPCLPVVDRGGHLVGIIDDDAVLAALLGLEPARTPGGVPVVDDVMTRNPVVTVADAALEDAAQLMANAGVRHLPVVDDEERLIGILSDRDLRESLGSNAQQWFRQAASTLSETVASRMTPDPVALVSGTGLETALAVFGDERVGAIPIIDERDRVLGIVSYVDVLAWVADRHHAEEQTAH